jgi:hypothetical protein
MSVHIPSIQTIKRCTQTTGCIGKMQWNPKEGRQHSAVNRHQGLS